MRISLTDPIGETVLFCLLVSIPLILTFSKKENYTPLSLTQELKGFAILAVVFAHIGYALSYQPGFLFPLSIFAGVGVNLFLFLSGYGLTCSQMKKGGGIFLFYKRRLPKLFVPFWTVTAALFLLSYFLLGETYPVPYIIQSMLGIFTTADMYADLNSPLWYFSVILFYYILFPIVYRKKHVWITALILYLVPYIVVQVDPPFLAGVIGLYEVHMLAFPLGIVAAWFVSEPRAVRTICRDIYTRHEKYLYPALMIFLCLQIGYFAVHSHVGEFALLEEITSLYTMFGIVILFILKKREFKLLSLFGFLSYEIYLFHWPLLYKFDLLYPHLPAGVATLCYLGVFVGVALVLKKLFQKIIR